MSTKNISHARPMSDSYLYTFNVIPKIKSYKS